MAKVVTPRAALAVIDRAIQVHGGAGVSDDTPLAAMWGWHRAMRLFDGPDEVHLRSLARAELRREPALPLG
jgi:acyl-CoA dehydrogenase